jgi:hypothetical protein
LLPAAGRQEEVRGLSKTKQNLAPRLSEKTSWHPYSLQGLTTEKFILIVNLILKGEHTLLKLDRDNESEDTHKSQEFDLEKSPSKDR